MQDIYDLIIYGRGIQASTMLAESCFKGLKVALVSENEFTENQIYPPIIITRSFSRLFGFYRFKNNCKYSLLKKAAPHLIIHSETIHIMAIKTWQRILVRVYNLFHTDRIEIHNNQLFKGLSFVSGKFSIFRMSILLSKFAVNNGAELYQFSMLTSSQHKDNKYLVSFCDKISGKDFYLESKSLLIYQSLNKEEKSQKKVQSITTKISCFCYPSGLLDLKKNTIINLKNFEIKIIPWFDFVVFSVRSDVIMNQKDVLAFIQNHAKFIYLDENHISNYIQTDYISPVTENFCTFYYAGKQKQFHYKKHEDHFKFALKTISSIVKNLKSGKKRNLLNHRIVPVSDLEPYDQPLRIMELADKKYDLAKQIMNSPLQFKKLFYRYGPAIDLIINKAYEYRNQLKDNNLAWLKAEIWYCVNYEMCKTQDSFFHSYTDRWMDGIESDKHLPERFFEEIYSEGLF